MSEPRYHVLCVRLTLEDMTRVRDFVGAESLSDWLRDVILRAVRGDER